MDRAVEGILGSILQEWWDARYGYTLDASLTVLSLTGQKRGIVLAPAAEANQPQWNASLSLLGGRPGIAGDASAACLGTTPGSGDISPPLFTAGGSAYVYAIGYQVGDGLANDFSVYITHTDATTNFYLHDSGLQAVVRDTTGSGKAFTLDAHPEDTTAAHLTEQWCDSSVPNANASLDGVDKTAQAVTTGIYQTGARFGFLGNTSGASLGSGRVLAHVGVCNAIPSAAQRAALLAYAQATWGTP